jgi:outer membrane protein OmpA-like peptidoglycan-associated protein
MSEPLARPSDEDEPDDGDSSSKSDRRPAREDSFSRLRSIIVGPEQREILSLRAHLHDSAARTRDVSRVLPDALQLRAHDPQLMRALAPSIEEAITASVKKDPRPLADALFPVIGPAIRKAVAHTFDAMIESLNQTIERTVSWQAARWRVTAWQTGRPYAEVVLANTLEYRVEQVFLIHRETGLLLLQVATRDNERDADQISAMLTAITDFARDSFQVGQSDTLESLRVGDMSVAIAQGPYAIVAGVVRGSIPLSVRATFENAVESIHRQLGPALQDYNGDASAFEPARPILEACLISQRRAGQQHRSYRRWAVAAALLLAGVSVWVFLQIRAERAWNAYLSRLRSEPGIVVIASERRGGKFFVSGLRDTLAADPESLLDSSSPLTRDVVESRWEPYQALHPNFVTARATRLLRPPAGVSLTFAEGTLTANGTAPDRWIDETERLAPFIGGVRAFVFAGERTEARIVAQIEAAGIRFARGQSDISTAEDPSLAAVRALLTELDDALANSGRRARVEVIGYASSDGPDDLNNSLSLARATRVVAYLRGGTFSRLDFSARGLGRSPASAGATEADHQRNRRVSFAVQLTENALRSVRP